MMILVPDNFISSVHYLCCSDCSEVKRKDYRNFCAVLCMTVVHNDMNTHVSSPYICVSVLFKGFSGQNVSKMDYFVSSGT